MVVGFQLNIYILLYWYLDVGKVEVLIVFKGCFGLLVFVEDGEFFDKCELSVVGDCFGVDLLFGVFYVLVVLELDSILFECKVGFYCLFGEGEFVSWVFVEGSVDVLIYWDWMCVQFV